MYGKIFRQIYHGTLATTGPWQALVTFQQLIVLADQDGTVDMTPQAIARETTIPLEIIESGLAALEQPDPESRSPDEEGRRIVRLSEGRKWGWRVVNYKHYRDLKREEDRRAYHRQYWHQRKDRSSTTQPSLNNTQQPQQNQPIAEAKAYTEAKAVSRDVEQALDGAVRRIFLHWQTEYQHPRAHLDAKRRRLIAAALKAYDEATVCASISGYKLSPHHMGQNEQSTVYDDIGLFLRDTEHIERGLGFSRSVTPARSRIQQLQEKLRGKSDERVVSEQNGSGEGGMVAIAGVLR